jgi:hypothetical protein
MSGTILVMVSLCMGGNSEVKYTPSAKDIMGVLKYFNISGEKYDKGPVWDHDPVRVAGFTTKCPPHMTREGQLLSQKQGIERGKFIIESQLSSKWALPVGKVLQLQVQYRAN